MSSRRIFASWVLAVAAFALTSTAFASAAIGSGYSGMWFDPARSGEGLQLDVMDADKAVVYWYTYDDTGAQRWLFGVGQIAHDASGDSIHFPQIQVTHGGKFGSGFKPSDVTYTDVGTIDLSFSDCNNGTFKYSAYGQSQSLPVQRLTQTMGAGCQSINGVPGEPVQAYAGQSGNWFDIAHSGEGFDLHWMSRNEAIVTWYTYDANGNQAWLLGTGVEQNGSIVFDRLISTSGPKFGTAFGTSQYQEHDWGTLSMTLNCDSGTAHYASTQAGFGSGNFTLTRLTALQKPACPYVKPKFSDLYSIAWDDIPVSDGTSTDPNAIQADTIANDGTIAGRRAGHLVLWHPDTRTWEDIPRSLYDTPVYISPDGKDIVANDVPVANSEFAQNVLLWQRSTDWQALANNGFSQIYAMNVSRNFAYVAVAGSNDGSQIATWIQMLGGPTKLLPQGNASPTTAMAVSDDGNVVIGRTPGFYGDWPGFIAVRWVGNAEPVILHNPAGDELPPTDVCSADCGIVFGAGINPLQPAPANPGAPWFLKSDGTFAFLGTLPDEFRYDYYPTGFYRPYGTAPDGSLVVGSYTIGAQQSNPGVLFYGPFLWTQATGMVAVWALTSEIGIGDADWSTVDWMQLSADGTQMLIVGKRKTQPDVPRAVVLHLTPNVSAN